MLGEELMVGTPEGIDDGRSVKDGASLGPELGRDEGMKEGRPDTLGPSLGCRVGQAESEGD